MIFLSPFFLIGGYFVFADEMKIIYTGESPLFPGALMKDRIFQARWLEQHEKDYVAFIFGYSRSKAFKTKQWCKCLSLENKLFHIRVSDENCMELLKRWNTSIRWVMYLRNY